MFTTTKLFTLCLAASALILLSLAPVRSYKVVRDEDGGLFLVYPKRGVASRIPDERTLAALKLDHLPVANTTKQQLAGAYRMENTSLSSLNFDVKTRDDFMLHEIRTFLALSPPLFWKETYYLGHMFNPALEHWHGKTFFTWRKGHSGPINAAWFSFEKLFKRRQENIDNNITDADDALPGPFDHDYPYFEKIATLSIKQFDFNRLQEDPRLLARRDGSLAIIYTSKQYHGRPPKQAYCHIRLPLDFVNSSTDFPSEFVAMNSTVLDGHSFGQHQKNWVALEYKQELYFLQSVNPLVVVQHNGSTGSDPNIGAVKVVYSAPSAIALPWKKEYGLIRGGSPAVLVAHNHSQYYLSLFHTQTQLQSTLRIASYLMGAISFCPSPPFHIHAISTHPIVQDKFYDGPWVYAHGLDYVVFPMGLLQRPDDAEHVYVSFGHQDRYGYLAKFHLEELFASMEVVNPCNN